MSVFTYKQRNHLVLAIIIILGLIIIYSLGTLFNAILSAIVLYTIFKPMYLKFEQRIGKVGSAVSIILISFTIIIMPFIALSYMVINKSRALKADQFQFKAVISKIDDYIGLKFNKANVIDHYLDKVSSMAEEFFPSIVGGALGTFLTVTIMYFLLYFMLTEMNQFEENVLKYAPLKEKNAISFAQELKNTTYTNILGQGVIALIQGMLVSIVFFIVGINDAIFWGVIGVFLSFVPVIGAPLITIPASLILLVNGETWQGVFLFIFTITILINIDNVLRFIINKKVANMHPVITVIGVVIGIPMFGFLGLVFGPLLLSWFIHFVQVYEKDIVVAERLETILTKDE